MIRRRRNPAGMKTKLDLDMAEMKRREPCSPWGISLAWISPEGKIFYPEDTHSSWAWKHMQCDSSDLLQAGWAQAHSSGYFTVADASALSIPTKRVMAQVVAYCILARKVHHEAGKVSVYDLSHGDDRSYTPANFVRAFGGRRMEDDLFGDMLRGARVNRSSKGRTRRRRTR